MEEIHDSVTHLKLHVLNMDIILITETKVSPKLFFPSRGRNAECHLAERCLNIVFSI